MRVRAQTRDAGLIATETRVGIERSAASEGVPAALRLSKSAQSADKVRFSDSNPMTDINTDQS